MAHDNFAVDLAVTSTTQTAPLGTQFIEPAGYWQRDEDVAGVGGAFADQGERWWKFVQLVTDTGVQGSVIRRAVSADDTGGAKTYASCRLTDAANVLAFRIPGVAQIAWTAGNFGWVLNRGKGAVMGDAAITRDLMLATATVSGTNGRADDTATGADADVAFFAMSLSTGSGAGVLVDAWINALG